MDEEETHDRPSLVNSRLLPHPNPRRPVEIFRPFLLGKTLEEKVVGFLKRGGDNRRNILAQIAAALLVTEYGENEEPEETGPVTRVVIAPREIFAIEPCT